MPDACGKFAQRNQNKPPFSYALVRDVQSLGTNYHILVEQDVDVNRAWPLVDAAPPTDIPFHSLQGLQQLKREQVRYNLSHAVDEPWLGAKFHRLSLIKRRNPPDFNACRGDLIEQGQVTSFRDPMFPGVARCLPVPPPATLRGMLADAIDAFVRADAALGRDVSGRVAARLGWGCLADVVKVAMEGDQIVATRPVYSGKAFATVDGAGKPVVVTLRPNVFPAQTGGGAAEVETLPAGAGEIRAVVREIEAKEGGELDVAEADVIVSGGRGIKGAENFALIREFASVLGAAVGASRAVVDAGWIDHAHQVGQTGKVVSPSLYVACGISGAIQHLAGMSSSKVIVAINTDPEAPIFKVADYGVVGDLFKVLPPLIDEIKKLKSEN